jgi:hypothetical protein
MEASMARLERLNSSAAVKITTDPATSQKIPYGAVAGGVLMVTSGSGTITWHCQATPDGDLFPMFDSEGAACETAVSEGNAFDMPACLFACPFIVGGGCDIEGFIAVSS